MGSEKISWSRFFLVLLIIIVSAGGGVLLGGIHKDYAILLFLLTLILSLALLSDIRRSERSVMRFFDSVSSGDFLTRFDESGRDPVLRRLHRHMNMVIRKISELRMKSEASERYYRAILQQSATGLVVLNRDEGIEVINAAAARFAGISPASSDTRLLKIRNPGFFDQLRNISPGYTITYRDPGVEPVKAFLLRAIEIEVAGNPLKVISIDNIRRELEQTELESYQRLIRILTHEIMNSVAPLTSVSSTLKKLFSTGGKPLDPAHVDGKLIQALIGGLSTIDDQTQGMVQFVNNYRKLTRLPEPVIAPFDPAEWIENLKILIAGLMEEADIRLTVSTDPGVKVIHADRNLLGQVILNLVNNARDALMERPSGREMGIELFRHDLNHVYLRISNNGPMITPENLERIFIPFFTTRISGSGIGLFISRQIVHLHRGLLSVSSREDTTAFLIELPDFPGS
jgi:two-component system, NtrC family, nitrogen regulation sensor histidine kinase NtrY